MILCHMKLVDICAFILQTLVHDPVAVHAHLKNMNQVQPFIPVRGSFGRSSKVVVPQRYDWLAPYLTNGPLYILSVECLADKLSHVLKKFLSNSVKRYPVIFFIYFTVYPNKFVQCVCNNQWSNVIFLYLHPIWTLKYYLYPSKVRTVFTESMLDSLYSL